MINSWSSYILLLLRITQCIVNTIVRTYQLVDDELMIGFIQDIALT